MKSKSEFRFEPAIEKNWPELEKLFGERGACGGCWCMAWRVSRAEWAKAKGAGNKRALKRLVSSDVSPGILAFHGSEAVGWCAIAPRESYPTLERSRILAAVDDKPVWSVSCFFIAKPWRNHGLSTQLLEHAARYARSRGARVLEGYPHEPGSKRMVDVFAWTGVVGSFARAGFQEVARRSKSRPIMRRDL